MQFMWIGKKDNEVGYLKSRAGVIMSDGYHDLNETVYMILVEFCYFTLPLHLMCVYLTLHLLLANLTNHFS